MTNALTENSQPPACRFLRAGRCLAQIFSGANGLVWLILALALLARLVLVPYGLPLLLYEDEPIYLNHALGFGLGAWDLDYFKKPSFFLYFYGAFYYLAYLYTPFLSWSQYVTAFWENPTYVASVGRLLSVVFATGSVYWLARLGTRAISVGVGLAAAFWLAINPIHLRYSPIVISDIPALFFILATAWFALKVFERGYRRDYLLCGLMIAMTISFKYNVFVFAFLVAGHGLRVYRDRQSWPDFWRTVMVSPPFWMAVLLIPVVFLLLNPMILLNFGDFWADINLEKRHMLYRNPHADTPQWQFMAAFGNVFFKILPRALDWPIFVAGLLGIPYLLWRYRLRGLMLLSFMLVFLLVVLQFRLINAKYLLPLYPFWFLAAASLLQDGLQRLKLPRRRQTLLFALVVLLMSWPTLDQSVRYIWVYTQPDTRQVAATYFQQVAVEGDRFLLEPETLSLDPRLFRTRLIVTDYRQGRFQTDDGPLPGLNPAGLSALQPRYVVLNLGEAEKQETPTGAIYYEMPHEPAYYKQLQTDYRLHRVFAPYTIFVPAQRMTEMLSEQGFSALYSEIQAHKTERQQPGPLLLVLKRSF